MCPASVLLILTLFRGGGMAVPTRWMILGGRVTPGGVSADADGFWAVVWSDGLFVIGCACAIAILVIKQHSRAIMDKWQIWTTDKMMGVNSLLALVSHDQTGFHWTLSSVKWFLCTDSADTKS